MAIQFLSPNFAERNRTQMGLRLNMVVAVILNIISMKLWQKEGTEVNKEIERFTVGRDRELDVLLAKHDVTGTLAHITMLESIGLLEKAELPILVKELRKIYDEIVEGNFVIEDGIEDVHSQVEYLLNQKLKK